MLNNLISIDKTINMGIILLYGQKCKRLKQRGNNNNYKSFQMQPRNYLIFLVSIHLCNLFPWFLLRLHFMGHVQRLWHATATHYVAVIFRRMYVCMWEYVEVDTTGLANHQAKGAWPIRTHLPLTFGSWQQLWVFSIFRVSWLTVINANCRNTRNSSTCSLQKQQQIINNCSKSDTLYQTWTPSKQDRKKPTPVNHQQSWRGTDDTYIQKQYKKKKSKIVCIFYTEICRKVTGSLAVTTKQQTTEMGSRLEPPSPRHILLCIHFLSFIQHF